MTDLERYLLQVISQLQSECEATHRAPVCVSLRDIESRLRDDAKTALNGLISGKLAVWYNVNGIPMFKVNPTQNEN